MALFKDNCDKELRIVGVVDCFTKYYDWKKNEVNSVVFWLVGDNTNKGRDKNRLFYLQGHPVPLLVLVKINILDEKKP